MLIGITGRAGSGKNTVADMLTELLKEQGVPTMQLAFADDVKTFAKAMGWNGEKDERGRRLLQLLGTDCGRECIDPNIWINRLRFKIQPELVTIITDVRFPNEAEFIREIGYLIRVTGRELGNLDRRHASESFVEDLEVDYELYNDDTVEYLFKTVRRLFDAQLIRHVSRLRASNSTGT